MGRRDATFPALNVGIQTTRHGATRCAKCSPPHHPSPSLKENNLWSTSTGSLLLQLLVCACVTHAKENLFIVSLTQVPQMSCLIRSSLIKNRMIPIVLNRRINPLLNLMNGSLSLLGYQYSSEAFVTTTIQVLYGTNFR